MRESTNRSADRAEATFDTAREAFERVSESTGPIYECLGVQGSVEQRRPKGERWQKE